MTNFGIVISNPYAFVLLHLRNKTNKSSIGVKIPEVTIFYDRMPYDIVSSVKGFIRGHKTHENARIRLKEVNKVFKETWGHLPKTEPILAAFECTNKIIQRNKCLYYHRAICSQYVARQKQILYSKDCII